VKVIKVTLQETQANIFNTKLTYIVSASTS